MKLLVPCASGIEASVKRELRRFGYGDRPAISGRIALEGGWEDVARLNIGLRAGDRVLIELGRFPARTFDELFEGVFSLPWEEYLTPHARVVMDGKSVGSALAAIKAAGGVAKKAILRRLGERLGARVFDEKGERAVAGVSLENDIASVTLDTSGDGLHKRGYRVIAYDAPLRETTAAAIVESSFYRADKLFVDPFCGSGTIPIEAVLTARNIAPGKNRSFDFEQWKCVPKDVPAQARRDAAEREFRGEIAPVFASDISPRAVNMAREHARRAGVEKDIRFSVSDARAFTSSEPYGVMIVNPPYGERLGSKEELFPLYRDFARMFRALPDWSCYLLSAYDGTERAFGKCAEKRRIYNARLSCTLYVYAGKKPPKKMTVL